MRPKDLFVSESLTPVRNSIYKTLRNIKRQHSDIIAGCGTADGRVFAYTKGTEAAAADKKHWLNTMAALKTFCRVQIRQPVENFLNSAAS